MVSGAGPGRPKGPAGTGTPSDGDSPLHAPVLSWYADHARDLPWRGPGVSAWGVLVSEIMLQQTPVVRVDPVWREWMARWPTPADLAAVGSGAAVRAWGRLGYPRRALRLHAAAGAITADHGGEVPSDLAVLRSLPGVGAYTSAAVAAFAFGARCAVVDTNVRRVQARAVTGAALPAPALSAAETALAERLVPRDRARAATWAVAVMELGAVVCTARSPRCGACPVADRCAWQLAGAPAHDGPARRGQAWHGTDRQVRGRLLALLREADGPLDDAALTPAWPDDDAQRTRCLASLVADALVEPEGAGYQLPALPRTSSPPPRRAPPAALVTTSRALDAERGDQCLHLVLEMLGGPGGSREGGRASEVQDHPAVAQGVGLHARQVQELRHPVVVAAEHLREDVGRHR